VDQSLSQKSIAAQRARVIAKHLEKWNSFDLEPREKLKRRMQPHWFKSKEPPQIDMCA